MISDVDELTSHLSKSGVWKSHDGVIQSEITGASAHLSLHKSREWERSASRPYHATLPYHVRRFMSRPGWYRYDTQDAAYFGGAIREEAGTYMACEKGLANSFCWAEEVGDLATKLVADAQNACFDSMAGQTWNAPVFLAELHKTTETLHSLATKAVEGAKLAVAFKQNPRKAIRAMRRTFGRWSRGTRLPPASSLKAANIWLEWRYSVNTGLQDVSEAARTTADLLLDKSGQKSRRVTSNRSGALELPFYGTADSAWDRQAGLGLSLGSNIEHRLTRVAHVHAMAWFDCTQTNSFLTDANQLGLLNVPAAVYELTAMSFVADWLLDIGSFLERCMAGVGYYYANGGYSAFRRVAGEHKVHDYGYFVTPSRLFQGSGASYESSEYNRYVWVNPSPVWTPALRMNTNRWLDAAALFRSIPLGKIRIA